MCVGVMVSVIGVLVVFIVFFLLSKVGVRVNLKVMVLLDFVWVEIRRFVLVGVLFRMFC